MISIFERSTRNSGIIGGKFLEKTRVPKPGSSVENPEYYTPADFSIGATVEGIDQWHHILWIIALLFLSHAVLFSAVFRHRFVLMDADRYVLRYLESLYNHVPEHTLSSLRQKFGVSQTSDQEEQHEGKNVCLLVVYIPIIIQIKGSLLALMVPWRSFNPWNLSISQKVLKIKIFFISRWKLHERLGIKNIIFY